MPVAFDGMWMMTLVHLELVPGFLVQKIISLELDYARCELLAQ